MIRKLSIIIFMCINALSIDAHKTFKLSSPDGTITTNICAGSTLTYDICIDNHTILAPSAINMSLSNGIVWGKNVNVKKSLNSVINTIIPSPFYRATHIIDHCNVLTLQCSGGYDVEFRAYNNGVAYRLISHQKKPFYVMNEGVEYNLTTDCICTAPYVRNFDPNNLQTQYNSSFENTYTVNPISRLDKRRLCFLPLVIDTGNNGIKLCITESHLENYPGLYLQASDGNVLHGTNAPYPHKLNLAHRNLEIKVESAEDYIAKVEKTRTFPWRIAMISRCDKELAENNLSYLLGAPCRITDTSWIRPGKVAWEWWNNWNIAGVNFKSGINTDTYKHYIDFASENGIEYILLDEGWSVQDKADLMQIVPEIDMKELVDYGKSRNVGIILWAGYQAFDCNMENVCRHYSEMGIKGFKVDFMDRDDQIVTDFYYRTAATCAKYHLLVDFHGSFKPSRLNRTYPNAINFEGVFGLEQMKWIGNDHDQMTYDCQIPFIRQAAGPLDYTQGAMINGTKGDYRPSHSLPMSQGTRCHQLGLYLVFDSPLSMLCDSPTNYRILGGKCTRFIAQVPTVWDETKVLGGEIGKYVITARRKGSTWYVGGITNWDERDVVVNTADLDVNDSDWQIHLFCDGTNAHRRADDYKYIDNKIISHNQNITIHMAPGGGFAMILTKK